MRVSRHMVKASRLNCGYSAYISSAAGLTAARIDHQTPCENGRTPDARPFFGFILCPEDRRSRERSEVVLDDVAALEEAEASIEAFINRRSASQEEANRIEAAWVESERKHRDRRREANREAWRCFYLAQAERIEQTAAELAASHRARAAMLGDRA